MPNFGHFGAIFEGTKIGKNSKKIFLMELFSTSKISYIGLWLRLEFDLVHPTEENEKTHTFVAPKSVKMAKIGFFEY